MIRFFKQVVKKKRLIVKLSVVATVVGVGGFALYQGFRTLRADSDEQEKQVAAQDGPGGADESHPPMIPDDSAHGPAGDRRGASWNPSSAPSGETVIRGNNDDDEPGSLAGGPPPPTHFENDDQATAPTPTGIADPQPVSQFLPNGNAPATPSPTAIGAGFTDRYDDATDPATAARFGTTDDAARPGAATGEQENSLRSGDPPPVVGHVSDDPTMQRNPTSFPAATEDPAGATGDPAATGSPAGPQPGVAAFADGQADGGRWSTENETTTTAPAPVDGAGRFGQPTTPQTYAEDTTDLTDRRASGDGASWPTAATTAGTDTPGGVPREAGRAEPERFSPDPVPADVGPAAHGYLGSNDGFPGEAPAGAAAPIASAAPAADVPGPRELEGAQTPSIVVEKLAPDEIQIGIEATFEMRVRNVGTADAHDVVIRDRIPQGTRFVDASADYQLQPDGSIRWRLETLKTGAETLLSLRVMPEEEGEIGSVAQVSFNARASVRTVCTRPLLEVRHTAPQRVLIGETVTFAITISNPGTGAATDVVLEEDVPEGLVHDAGQQLEYKVGTLRPGESRELALTLRAGKAGLVRNRLRVHGNGNLDVQDELELEVIAPRLQVGIDGPTLRYLNRKATYTVSVSNPGTATARNVDLIAYLPQGLKFLSTEHEGHYDAQRHAVMWSLEQLPAQQAGEVRLSVMPIEPGEQKIRMEGRADLNLSHAFEQNVVVDARPELQFSIADSADPIEIGSETVYEIRVSNAGAKTATNVRLVAVLPQGLKLEKADGPTRGTINGQQVLFEPLSRLDPSSNVSYQIRATGSEAGDHRIQVQISNDDNQVPIAHEESTRVYQDQ